MADTTKTRDPPRPTSSRASPKPFGRPVSASTMPCRCVERISTAMASEAASVARPRQTDTATADPVLVAMPSAVIAPAVWTRVVARMTRSRKNMATKTSIGTKKNTNATDRPLPAPAQVSSANPTSHRTASASAARALSDRTRARHAVNASATPVAAAIGTTWTPCHLGASPTRGTPIVARMNKTRMIDSGLSSSIGAPSANHERTFGNQRFATSASAVSRVLVTSADRAVVVSQPRHEGPLTGRRPRSPPTALAHAGERGSIMLMWFAPSMRRHSAKSPLTVARRA